MAGATLGLLLYAYFFGGPVSQYLLFAIPCVAALLAFVFRRMSKKNCLNAIIGAAFLAPLCLVSFLIMADPLGAISFLPAIGIQIGFVLAGIGLASRFRHVDRRV